MATKTANHGPFLRRIRLETAAVEARCADALRSVKLMPAAPGPIRIDRFAEKFFKLKLRFVALAEARMGAVQFTDAGKVAGIFVCKNLAQDETTVGKRKFRSTVAHECGHGLLHGELFAEKLAADKLQPVLATGSGEFHSVGETGFLCRGEADLDSTPKYEWWEFQANMAMSALLLPWHLVTEAAKPFAAKCAEVRPALRDAVSESAASELAEVFDVNPVMIRFRLKNWWKEALQLNLL
jgi:hypothetical protein